MAQKLACTFLKSQLYCYQRILPVRLADIPQKAPQSFKFYISTQNNFFSLYENYTPERFSFLDHLFRYSGKQTKPP